jgi:hypothetical protein
VLGKIEVESIARKTAHGGAMISILARRPFRPTSRTVRWTAPTSTLRDSPSWYHSMDLATSCGRMFGAIDSGLTFRFSIVTPLPHFDRRINSVPNRNYFCLPHLPFRANKASSAQIATLRRSANPPRTATAGCLGLGERHGRHRGPRRRQAMPIRACPTGLPAQRLSRYPADDQPERRRVG